MGEWVNVIGYVSRDGSAQSHKAFRHTGGAREQGRKQQEEDGAAVMVDVQAIMLWSAGALSIEQYVKAVEGRKALR